MSEAKNPTIHSAPSTGADEALATALFVKTYGVALGNIRNEKDHDVFAKQLAQRCIRSARLLREELAKGEQRPEAK